MRMRRRAHATAGGQGPARHAEPHRRERGLGHRARGEQRDGRRGGPAPPALRCGRRVHARWLRRNATSSRAERGAGCADHALSAPQATSRARRASRRRRRRSCTARSTPTRTQVRASLSAAAALQLATWRAQRWTRARRVLPAALPPRCRRRGRRAPGGPAERRRDVRAPPRAHGGAAAQRQPRPHPRDAQGQGESCRAWNEGTSAPVWNCGAATGSAQLLPL